MAKKAKPDVLLSIDAIFCDCATVREGLIHILGGGITRIYRDQYPALMGLHLGMTIHCPAELAGKTQELALILNDSEGQTLSRANLTLTVNAQGPVDAQEEILVPLAAGFQNQVLPKAGSYDLELNLNGKPLRSLRLRALTSVQAG